MNYIEEGLIKQTIKICPHCDSMGELASGCNYIKCPVCHKEWCWLCNKPKYKIIPEKSQEGCCNNKSHNSH